MKNTNRKYSIYIIKNNVNDKVYIGQTCQSVHERFLQHLKPSILKQRGTYKLYNAINKYGKENFYYDILETGLDYDMADEKEIYYISKYNSYYNGYNSTLGGDVKTISKVQDIQLLLKMAKNKKTLKEMADTFNVCKATITRTLSSLDYSLNKRVKKEYLLKNKDIKTNIQMAQELNVHPYTITRAFKKFNIKRGTGCNNHLLPQNNKRIIDK